MEVVRTTKAVMDIIRRGGVVAMPTDTVYGLIAIATARTKKRIVAIKQSPKNKKILLLVGSLAAAERISRTSRRQRQFLSRVWPGPVTVVLKNKLILPGFSEDTLALRVPKNPVLLHVLKNISVPLTATSANISGRPAPVTTRAVFQEFKFSKEKPDAIFQPLRGTRGLRFRGRSGKRAASTIVAFRGSRIIILREGAIAREKVEGAWRASGRS